MIVVIQTLRCLLKVRVWIHSSTPNILVYHANTSTLLGGWGIFCVTSEFWQKVQPSRELFLETFNKNSELSIFLKHAAREANSDFFQIVR